jgi:PhzF family phenazine biosynthesis protein
MRSYVYKKVDAFTSGNSCGNPAAFIDSGDEVLPDAEMLRIAREHKGFVSEVVFLTRKNGILKLTYYSSECEVAFCGHGTIATLYDVVSSDPVLCAQPELVIETNRKGKLTVFNDIPRDNALYITAPEPQWLCPETDRQTLAAALNMPVSGFFDGLPVDCVDAGLRTLIVPVADLQQEITMTPDRAVLESYCRKVAVDIILTFSRQTLRESAFAHTRVFAPKFGYLEDPATGSGNSAFGYYLKKNRLWDGSAISVEQGNADMIFNEVRLRSRGTSVLFGGQAKKRIEGVYYPD